MNFFTTVGKLVALILAYHCFESLSVGDWRKLMLYNGLIAMLGPIFISLFLIESPRFLLAMGKFDKAFTNLNKMGRINNGKNYKEITWEEKE